MFIGLSILAVIILLAAAQEARGDNRRDAKLLASIGTTLAGAAAVSAL